MPLTEAENQQLYDFEHAILELGDRRVFLNDMRKLLHDDLATLKLYQALELLGRADKLLDEAYSAEVYRYIGEGRLESRPERRQI